VWKTPKICRESPRTRYGIKYDQFGTAHSRVFFTRPSRPIVGNYARLSTLAKIASEKSPAAFGFSSAI
jgi:hypothetical protein